MRFGEVTRVAGLIAEGFRGTQTIGRAFMDSESQHRDPPPSGQEPSVEDWRATVDRLQELVCMLLMKNQTMRTTLSNVTMQLRVDAANGTPDE